MTLVGMWCFGTSYPWMVVALTISPFSSFSGVSSCGSFMVISLMVFTCFGDGRRLFSSRGDILQGEMWQNFPCDGIF